MEVQRLLLSEMPDCPDSYQTLRLAVHLHLFYADLIDETVGYLQSIPIAFDLLLSVPDSIGVDEASVCQAFSSLSHLVHLDLRRTPNRGRDIAPMICTFADAIQQYDLVLHFHTKKSPHGSTLRDWRIFLLEHLLGSPALVGKVLTALSGETGIVGAPDFIPSRNKGWLESDNLPVAQQVIDRSSLHLDLATEYPAIQFPQGSFFWARTDYLRPLFALGLQYDDFPSEPIAADGTLAHALERLFFVWGRDTGRKPAQVFESRSELIHNAFIIPESSNMQDSLTHLWLRNVYHRQRVTRYRIAVGLLLIIIGVLSLYCFLWR